MLLKYTKFNKWINAAVVTAAIGSKNRTGTSLLNVCVGLMHGISSSSVYILIASVAPVWALLQPRDYLNSYLLIFMIAARLLVYL